MAMTYTWAVTGWETRTEPGAPDGTGAERAATVIQTRWTKTGKDGSFEGVFSGATPFSAADVTDADFVTFADLTEKKVLDWIKPIVVGDYETHVNEQIQKAIDLKKNPKVDQPVPWAPEPPVPPG